MKIGNLNTSLDSAKRNGSVINRLGELGDSVNPMFSMENIPPMEIRWIRLSGGEKKIEPHKHENIQTLITLIRGRHEITINGREKVVLRSEGDYIFIEPGDLHTWETKEDALLLVVRWKI